MNPSNESDSHSLMTPQQQAIERLLDNIAKAVIGQKEAVEQVVLALLAEGHVLIEDVPGVGKTLLARALAKSISATFRRIQFTPDLLPADITGGYIYNQGTSEFQLRKGPIFGQIVLADEINRGSPRTQSSLLECMAEGAVTLDGQRQILPEPFFSHRHAESDRVSWHLSAAGSGGGSVLSAGAVGLSDAGRRKRHPGQTSA